MSTDFGFATKMLIDLPESEATTYIDFRRTLISNLALVEKDKRKRSRLIRRKLPKDRIDVEKFREMTRIAGSQPLDNMLTSETDKEEELQEMLNKVSQLFEEIG